MNRITIHPVNLNVDDALLYYIRTAVMVELCAYRDVVDELDITLSRLKLVTQQGDMVVCRYQLRTVYGKVIVVRSSGDSVMRAVLRTIEPLCAALAKERSQQRFKSHPFASNQSSTSKSERMCG